MVRLKKIEKQIWLERFCKEKNKALLNHFVKGKQIPCEIEIEVRNKFVKVIFKHSGQLGRYSPQSDHSAQSVLLYRLRSK